jgi:hypothetical protein
MKKGGSMKKWLLIVSLIFIGCSRPIVNYSPVELSYPKHIHSEIDSIQLFMQGKEPPIPYEVIGEASVPLKVVHNPYGDQMADVTQEQAIKALQAEALKRGCDAVIDIHYTGEWRDRPAAGVLTSNYGIFSGSGQVYADFIIGTLVIWEK